MLRTAADSLPTRRTGTSHPPVVSIHVAAPAKLALITKADLVAHVVATPGISAERWVVLEDRPAGPTVAPFALPLDVVAIGDRGTDVLEDVRAGPWMSQDEQTQAYLASIEWFAEPTSVVARLAEREIDLLVLDASDAHTLDRLIGRRARSRVRVAVVLGVGDGGMLDAIVPRLRFVRSVLTVKGPPDGGQLQVLRSFLIALSHDLPLHDALILTRTANPARGIELSASPVSLHDLRLTSAWAAVERSLTELSGSVGRGAPDLLRQQITDLLPAADHAFGRDLVSGVSEARNLQLNFAQEKGGLHRLAGALQGLARAARSARSLRGVELSQPAAVPGERPVRVVNLGLRRRGDMVAAAGAVSSFVDVQRSVVANGRYELDVQIGAAWPGNLVIGEQPAVDLLLPDDRRGHDLEVSVFSEAVRILDGAIRTLQLPPEGPSGVVTFALVMPTVEGASWLRVSIYHRNNLLETFLLELLVEAAERIHPRTVLSAHLQHSATRDWGNLDALGGRALSLTLNADPAGGHRLFLKGHDAAATLPVDEKREEALTADVRQTLTMLVDRKLGSAAAVWKLASKGGELVRRLFEQADDSAKAALGLVAQSADQTVQVVRANLDRAVPWSLVYDWPLPRVLYGAPDPPVCFGRTESGDRCTHGFDDKKVCVYGFWGIRHRLEELLADPSKTDLPDMVAVADPSILVALGIPDNQTAELVPRLSSVVAPGNVRTLGEQDLLLDWLFRLDRPAVVVILGHHETRNLIGEPPGSRITLLTGDGWLLDKEITERRIKNPQQPLPHSLVLLLSCGSAVIAPTQLTSFLSALTGVRASAIVGTACDVYSDLAADFATHLLTAMTTGLSTEAGTGNKLGAGLVQAAQFARQRIVIDKEDARGLAFDAFGPAGLTLVRA
jgi:hypothetical protein